MYLDITMSVCAATSWSTYSTAGVLDRSLGADTSGSWSSSTSTSELVQQGEHCMSCTVSNSPKVNWVATLEGVARLPGAEISNSVLEDGVRRTDETGLHLSGDTRIQSQGAVFGT